MDIWQGREVLRGARYFTFLPSLLPASYHRKLAGVRVRCSEQLRVCVRKLEALLSPGWQDLNVLLSP